VPLGRIDAGRVSTLGREPRALPRCGSASDAVLTAGGEVAGALAVVSRPAGVVVAC
jgi:hypothetical protein